VRKFSGGKRGIPNAADRQREVERILNLPSGFFQAKAAQDAKIRAIAAARYDSNAARAQERMKEEMQALVASYAPGGRN
jgi:hypothetical protein